MKRDHARQPIIVPVGLHSRSLMERLRLVAAAFSAEDVALSKQLVTSVIRPGRLISALR